MNRIQRIFGLATVLLCAGTAVAAQGVISPPELVGAVETADDAFDVVVHGQHALVPVYGAGLEVIHLGDPAHPAIVANHNTPGLSVQCATAGGIAYIADHAVGGLQVLDIAPVTSPSYLGSYVTGGTAVMAAHDNGMVLVGYAQGGIDFVDVSNPSQPQWVSSYPTTGAPRHAVFAGSLAFVADYGAGMRVLDVSDPAVPAPVGLLVADRPVGAFLAGDVVYLACADGLHAVDVTDPSTPSDLDVIAFPGPAVKVEVVGAVALVAAHVYGGLQVVNVSNPEALSVITSYIPGTYAHGVAAFGEHALLADGAGLKVFRVFTSTVPVRTPTWGEIKSGFGRE